MTTTPATQRTQRPTPSQRVILERCAGGAYIKFEVDGSSPYWHNTLGGVDRRIVEACERHGWLERRTTISGRPVSVLTDLGRQMLAEEPTP